MSRGVVFGLVVRPLFIVLAAVFVPTAVVLLFVAGARRPATVIGISSFICAIAGGSFGGSITEAARGSFAWTLPGYRRALLREFVTCGVAVSALTAMVGTVAVTAPYPTFVAFATGVAAFAFGGAVFLVPEASLLFPLVLVALLSFQRFILPAIINAPAVSFPVAFVVSLLALWAAFGDRTFRWSAVTGPRADGHFIWHEWPMLPWWPRRHPRVRRTVQQATTRARYAGTSLLRSVISTYGTTRPLTAWLAILALLGLGLAALGPATLETVRFQPLPWLWIVLVAIAWKSAVSSRGSASRTALPWSRRRHLSVTWVRDAMGVLAFLLVLTPMFAMASMSVDRAVLGGVGRVIAVVAAYCPAIQWLGGQPCGGRWPDRGMTTIVLSVTMLVLVVFLNLVVTGLPKLVSSGVAQAVLLGLLVIGSQVLNWRILKRYFAERDLVGGTLY